MKNDRSKVEERILETVRKSTSPSEPKELVAQVSEGSTSPRLVREAVRTLIDRGELHLTLDWRLSADG